MPRILGGMTARIVLAALVLCAAFDARAHAASLDINVVDTKGKAARDVVVTLMPERGRIDARAPERGVIDQRRETYLPLVTIIRVGGSLIFTNNDTTMHQVYSFSPIKQFQLETDRGQTSKPVIFEKPGVAAIGCNIHDNMVAYVFVSDAPFAVLSDANGHARLSDIPQGSYRARIWHPNLPAGKTPPSVTVAVGEKNGNLTLALPIALAPDRGMKHKHTQEY